MCCVRSAYCCSHSLSRNLQSTRLRDQKHCSFKKGLECSWKSWNIKAITCVLGRHTPWTPLVATSMAHQVQACFFLLSTLCIQKPHLISLVFLFLTVLLAFLGHLPPMTSYKFLAIILFFCFSLFLCSCTNYLELLSWLNPFFRYSTLFGTTLKHTFSSSF